jgi:hypothetical protein
VNPGAEQVAQIAGRNWDGFDWDEFLRFAEHHGVLALAAYNLSKHACGLPEEARRPLQTAYDDNVRRSLWFAAELVRIVEHFARRQVRVIPYKGPVLAQLAYGDVGLRNYSDLDLLIAPADFERAKQALAEIGYRPSQEFRPAVERMWMRTGYERSFDGAAGKNLVELQWALLPYFYAVDLSSVEFRIEDLLARAKHVELCGAGVPCLSPEDSLIALCLHAAKHLWTRLVWVADIAGSLRAPGIDFVLVASRARALGIARILGVSFWLTERLLNAPVPAAGRELVTRDSEVARLGEECAARLSRAATYDLESRRYFRQILKMRERAGDRWRYLWRLVWTPGPGEIAALRLPEVLFPLYRVVRIGRLVRKLG